MSNGGDKSDEITLGAIGVFLSFGVLKTNELFDFFDRVDVFKVEGTMLMVRTRELLAVVGFASLYLIFLTVAIAGIAYIIGRYPTGGGGNPLRILSHVILLMAAVQFFSLFAAYSHAMHRYGEGVKTAATVRWILN